MVRFLFWVLGMMALVTASVDFAAAHHVLGRPAYSLNEDSNTPPSMQAETRIGDYLVTYMVFPAFPEPGKPGRINIYASRLDNGAPFQGKVTFKVRSDSWYSWLSKLGMGGEWKTLGQQRPDDNVFRQGYEFHNAGDYIVAAEFQADGEPYILEFPLRIGPPPAVGPLGFIFGLGLVMFLIISVVQRRRSMTGRIRGNLEARDGKWKTP